MKSYPKVGTRVIVTDGEWKGRQGRTDKTVAGRGRIELTLLGGAFELGVAVPLAHVEKDPERKIRKLEPRPLQVGARLYSLTGTVYPIGRAMTIKHALGDGHWAIESDYSEMLTLRPTPGFEKRWALWTGHPLAPPLVERGDEFEGVRIVNVLAAKPPEPPNLT